jgi:hypothetical protein
MPNPPEHTKFKPGQSGNPNGRPKKLPDLEKLLVRVLGTEEDNKTGWEVIIEALQKKAAKGDVKAAELLLSRGYGKAKQFVNLNHEGGVSLVFEQATASETDTDKIHEGISEEPGSLQSETLSSDSESGFDEIG